MAKRPVFEPALNKQGPKPKVDNTSLFVTPVTITVTFVVSLIVTIVFNGL